MNKSTLIKIVLVLLALTISSCSSFTECDNINEKEVIILVDISDNELYKVIQSDIENNFSGFMQQSGLGEISSCQRLTVRLAPIESRNILNYSTESIEIPRKGLSLQEQRARANPAPLVELIRNKLDEYSEMSTDKVITSGSNIANIILKAINSSNIDAAESTIIIFSDLIENTQYVNMYREIPSGQDIANTTEKLLDPITLETFQERRQQGLAPSIIVVSKPSNNPAVKLRDVRNFWGHLFREELGLQDVEFVDNLSQYHAIQQ